MLEVFALEALFCSVCLLKLLLLLLAWLQLWSGPQLKATPAPSLCQEAPSRRQVLGVVELFGCCVVWCGLGRWACPLGQRRPKVLGGGVGSFLDPYCLASEWMGGADSGLPQMAGWPPGLCSTV